MTRKAVDPVAKELAAIKRLIILQLLTSGVPAIAFVGALGGPACAEKK